MAEEHEEEERERGKVMALIEKATNSTEPEVDPRLLKAIKMVVRYSDFELKLAVQTLMHLMKRQHSQVSFFCISISSMIIVTCVKLVDFGIVCAIDY